MSATILPLEPAPPTNRQDRILCVLASGDDEIITLWTDGMRFWVQHQIDPDGRPIHTMDVTPALLRVLLCVMEREIVPNVAYSGRG
jgi:hypothetical protein